MRTTNKRFEILNVFLEYLIEIGLSYKSTHALFATFAKSNIETFPSKRNLSRTNAY